jgi:hypothetical protein
MIIFFNLNTAYITFIFTSPDLFPIAMTLDFSIVDLQTAVIIDS